MHIQQVSLKKKSKSEMYFCVLEDIFQKMWTWMEYYKDSNTINSQFYTDHLVKSTFYY